MFAEFLDGSPESQIGQAAVRKCLKKDLAGGGVRIMEISQILISSESPPLKKHRVSEGGPRESLHWDVTQPAKPAAQRQLTRLCRVAEALPGRATTDVEWPKTRRTTSMA